MPPGARTSPSGWQPGRTIEKSTAKTRRIAKVVLREDPRRGGFLVVSAFVYLRAFVVDLGMFPHAVWSRNERA
jgi:hypothetical protein